MISFLTFFSIVHAVMTVFGLTFNGLLIYMAMYKTPLVIRAYATLIINFAFTDFMACLFDAFVQQRIIPTGLTLGYISVGVCKHFGETTCYVGYSLLLHSLSHALYSLLLSFSYRCYILYRPSPTRKSLIFVCLAVYQVSLFQFVSFLWAQDDPGEIRKILHERFPTYDLENTCITGTKNILGFSAMFTILHMTVPVSPIYMLILFLRTKIITRLSFQGVSVAKNTKNLHSQLLKALTYQAMIPGFYFFSVISYALGQFGIYNSPILECFTFTYVLFIPIFSPLASFIFVTPYKRFIIKSFFKVAPVEAPELSVTQNYAKVVG